MVAAKLTMLLGDDKVSIAAVAAGAETIRQMSNDISDAQRIIKGPRDFATQADIASEKEIMAIIKRERPQDDIIAEERGPHTTAIRSNARRWLVDPLCGTVQQRPSLGLALVEVNFYGLTARSKLFQLVSRPAFCERFHLRVHSTTLTVPWVAAGKRAAYISEGDMKDNLHYAAGIAICQSAGCLVTGMDGQPLHTGLLPRTNRLTRRSWLF